MCPSLQGAGFAIAGIALATLALIAAIAAFANFNHIERMVTGAEAAVSAALYPPPPAPVNQSLPYVYNHAAPVARQAATAAAEQVQVIAPAPQVVPPTTV